MRAYKSAVFALVAFLLAALPVRAQDARAVELTPYVALGSAGASPVGVVFTFPVTSTLSVETDVAYRRGEGNINALSLSANLLYSLPRVGQATTYVVGGVGLAQYGAPVFGSNGGRPIGSESRLALTVNAGGGLKMPVNEKLDLRTDARWFKSFGYPPGQGLSSFASLKASPSMSANGETGPASTSPAWRRRRPGSVIISVTVESCRPPSTRCSRAKDRRADAGRVS